MPCRAVPVLVAVPDHKPVSPLPGVMLTCGAGHIAWRYFAVFVGKVNTQ